MGSPDSSHAPHGEMLLPSSLIRCGWAHRGRTGGTAAKSAFSCLVPTATQIFPLGVSKHVFDGIDNRSGICRFTGAPRPAIGKDQPSPPADIYFDAPGIRLPPKPGRARETMTEMAR